MLITTLQALLGDVLTLCDGKRTIMQYVWPRIDVGWKKYVRPVKPIDLPHSSFENALIN